MSEYRGYTGMSLTFLKESNVKVGDSVKVKEDLTYTGILMPRYEHTDDKHIVLKLKSGYNIGIEVNKIKKIELLASEKIEIKSSPQIKTASSLPKVLLLSTGGTIASKIDYRTGNRYYAVYCSISFLCISRLPYSDSFSWFTKIFR